MALTHTILTILSHEPCSGYDISKRFEESVGCYWQASQQQIYRELGKMEKQGWVRYESIPQVGKPDKKIYELTSAGHEELMRWFAEPSEPTPIREDLLVKVMAGSSIPQPLLTKEVLSRRQLHEHKLSSYRELEQEFFHQQEPSELEKFRYLTLRRGIRYEESWIAWCDEVLAFLEK
jgi:DNA-binding PadR family transcriptional regulator